MCDDRTRSVPLMLDRGNAIAQQILTSVEACVTSGMQLDGLMQTNSVVYLALLHANLRFPSVPNPSCVGEMMMQIL
jgi:hypothetical protein